MTALDQARAACDWACDELAGALTLDPLPALVRSALAAALRQVAEAQGVVEAARGGQ